jgi:hypothetical protein
VFRNKFLAGLRQLYRKGLLDCHGPATAFSDHAWFAELIEVLRNKRWLRRDNGERLDRSRDEGPSFSLAAQPASRPIWIDHDLLAQLLVCDNAERFLA